MGIDSELFTSDKDMLYTFVCAICTDVAHPPFLFPCAAGHIFCEECIEKITSCPNDREPSNGRPVIHITGPLFRAYNNLKLNCPMHCEWMGPLGDLESHFPHCTNTISSLPPSPSLSHPSSPSLSHPSSPSLSPSSSYSFPSPSAPPLESKIPSSVDLAYNNQDLYPDPIKGSPLHPSAPPTTPSTCDIAPNNDSKEPARFTLRHAISREAGQSSMTLDSKPKPKPTDSRDFEMFEDKPKPKPICEDSGSESESSDPEVAPKKASHSSSDDKYAINFTNTVPQKPIRKYTDSWIVKEGTIYKDGIFHPYVVIRKSGPAGFFGSLVKTPATPTYTKDPVWNYEKKGKRDDVYIRNSSWSQVVVEMWDKRPFPEKDQLIGRAVCPRSFGGLHLTDPDNRKMINAIVYIDTP